MHDEEAVFVWANGDQYIGAWKNGRMHGFGKKIMKNGDMYEGVSVLVLLFFMLVGLIFLFFLPPSFFFFLFCFSLSLFQPSVLHLFLFHIHDFLSAHHANDTFLPRPKQQWKDDGACGFGLKVFACGDKHEGQYFNDRRHGHGTYTWVNGDSYTGQWVDGKMCGRGVKRMADGSVYDGVCFRVFF